MDQFRKFIGSDGHIYSSDYYIYCVNFGNSSAGAPGTESITIQADSNFEWIYSTVFATSTDPDFPYADGQALPITLQIADGGSGRTLFSQPVPISSLAGLGREPYVMPVTRLFMSKATVNFESFNFSATNFVSLNFCLHGQKIFDLGRASERDYQNYPTRQGSWGNG